jgi:hypothetical protein
VAFPGLILLTGAGEISSAWFKLSGNPSVKETLQHKPPKSVVDQSLSIEIGKRKLSSAELDRINRIRRFGKNSSN